MSCASCVESVYVCIRVLVYMYPFLCKVCVTHCHIVVCGCVFVCTDLSMCCMSLRMLKMSCVSVCVYTGVCGVSFCKLERHAQGEIPLENTVSMRQC